MNTYTPDELTEILNLHGKWCRGEGGGKRANLVGADLGGANLVGANLVGANLVGANLVGANLMDANLMDANLWGADLRGAKLLSRNGDELRLTGTDPILMFGPIGSRHAYMTIYHTDKGLYIATGCYKPGTVAEFLAAVEETHGDNIHAQCYRAAIACAQAVYAARNPIAE